MKSIGGDVARFDWSFVGTDARRIGAGGVLSMLRLEGHAEAFEAEAEATQTVIHLAHRPRIGGVCNDRNRSAGNVSMQRVQTRAGLYKMFVLAGGSMLE